VWWKSAKAMNAASAVFIATSWKSKLPYSLSFDMKTVRIEPPVLLEGIATGELQGHGLWQLSTSGSETAGETAGETIVRYDWKVETTKWWMNLLAPIARPLFEWNHNVVMSWGAKGLSERLE
jgi:hypothetical protein